MSAGGKGALNLGYSARPLANIRIQEGQHLIGRVDAQGVAQQIEQGRKWQRAVGLEAATFEDEKIAFCCQFLGLRDEARLARTRFARDQDCVTMRVVNAIQEVVDCLEVWFEAYRHQAENRSFRS